MYVTWHARGLGQDKLRRAPASPEPLRWRGFSRFFLPLAAMSLLSYGATLVLSAGLSRMPNPLETLAVWPVLSALVSLVSGAGNVYREVTVSLVDTPQGYVLLRRFSLALAAASAVLMVLFAATPLGNVWFGSLSGLSPRLVVLARGALWILVLLPAIRTYEAFRQGLLLHRLRTSSQAEAVALFLVVMAAMMAASVAWTRVPGHLVAAGAYMTAATAEALWIRERSQGIARRLEPPAQAPAAKPAPATSAEAPELPE
jgi:hypothetical protein